MVGTRRFDCGGAVRIGTMKSGSGGSPVVEAPHTCGLLTISNRLPEFRSPAGPGVDRRSVGGLVSALEPVARARGGPVARLERAHASEATNRAGRDRRRVPARRSRGSTTRSRGTRDYYNGFCNGTLWPLFHSFPSARHASRRRIVGRYSEVHERFADAARALVGTARDALGARLSPAALRGGDAPARAHRGAIGHFLHIPFPSLDMFSMIPWARPDRRRDARLRSPRLPHAAATSRTSSRAPRRLSCRSKIADDVVQHRGRRRHVCARCRSASSRARSRSRRSRPSSRRSTGSCSALGEPKLVLGVDRLDYTKGIPERLDRVRQGCSSCFPEWRGKVSLVQVSVPSRADVPRLRRAARSKSRAIVGRINGEFGEAPWMPDPLPLPLVHAGQHLRQLYRAARVGYVTPLRDGMNLVAKEYVAAQDPEDPGVLLPLAVRRSRRRDAGRHPHEPVPRRRNGARSRPRAPHAARGTTRAPPIAVRLDLAFDGRHVGEGVPRRARSLRVGNRAGVRRYELLPNVPGRTNAVAGRSGAGRAG